MVTVKIRPRPSTSVGDSRRFTARVRRPLPRLNHQLIGIETYPGPP
jgi:hypothetical protein